MGILAAIPLISKVLDRIIPDKNQRAKAQEALESAEQSGDLNLLLAQMEVNKVEAQHPSIFVSGWRPFIGWVCGVGLAYNVIVSPVLDIWYTMPVVDPGLLYPVLLGMLGLGTMRTAEKYKGVHREK